MNSNEQSSAFLPVTLGHGLVMILMLATWLWFITGGTWIFSKEVPPDSYYDALGQSLLQGRWDVPCDIIDNEALVKDGRCYGYFGPTPALIRLLFQLDGSPGGSILMALTVQLAFILLLVNVYWTGRSPTTNSSLFAMDWVLLLLGGVGSTSLFLTSPAFIYHEAIAWANALALGAYVVLWNYLRNPQAPTLFLALLLAALTLHARVSVGYGVILALTLTAVWTLLPFSKVATRGFLYKSAVAVLVLTLFTATTPFLISLEKYGELSLFPIKYYISYIDNPERTARIQGVLILEDNLLFNIYNYFDPASIRSSEWFPYFNMVSPNLHTDESSGIHFDRGEPVLAIPNSVPALFLLSILGVVQVFRRNSPLAILRIPVIGALAGGGMVLFISYISHRYIHDFFPFLILTGSAGLHWLGQIGHPVWRRLLAIGLAVLIMLSIYISIGTAFLSFFINKEMAQHLTAIRRHLDFPGSTLDLVQLCDERFCNGIGLLEEGLYLFVRGPLPESMGPGTRLLFNKSGERRVVRILPK